MVNIVGDHASYHLALDAALTSDIESLARPMSNWVRRIQNPADVAPAAEAAIRASQCPPGIATLILPADAAWGETQAAPIRKITLDPPAPVDPASVKAAAKAIRDVRGRAALLLGGNATLAEGLAIAGQIAEACDIRLFHEVFVVRAERGVGRVAPQIIPYPVDAALAVLKDIDVLIMVGAVEPVAFFAYPGKPGRLVPEACHVMTLAAPGTDLTGALEALRDELGVKRTAPLPAASRSGDKGMPTGRFTDDALSTIIAQKIPENGIVCEESITSILRFFEFSADAAPHDLIVPPGGAIGGGMPLATGAAIACPGRRVINLQADGSAMYTVQSLWTQARESLDVTTIIFSNRTYAILHLEMRNVGVKTVGRNARRMLDLDDPPLDWVSLARGLGVEAAVATDCEGLADLLDASLSRRGPFLIEARI
jgi:acetolactate synthase-1/2/3 large subunit